jgi:hypothetical protein
VLVEEIDAVGLEPIQRRLGNLLDVLRPAVQASNAAIGNLESELAGDHHLVAA